MLLETLNHPGARAGTPMSDQKQWLRAATQTTERRVDEDEGNHESNVKHNLQTLQP